MRIFVMSVLLLVLLACTGTLQSPSGRSRKREIASVSESDSTSNSIETTEKAVDTTAESTSSPTPAVSAEATNVTSSNSSTVGPDQSKATIEARNLPIESSDEQQLHADEFKVRVLDSGSVNAPQVLPGFSTPIQAVATPQLYVLSYSQAPVGNIATIPASFQPFQEIPSFSQDLTSGGGVFGIPSYPSVYPIPIGSDYYPIIGSADAIQAIPEYPQNSEILSSATGGDSITVEALDLKSRLATAVATDKPAESKNQQPTQSSNNGNSTQV